MTEGCVLGTGVDLIENERIDAALQRWGVVFKNRVFLPGEQAYCDSKKAPVIHYAVRFALKEAVSKALHTGIGKHIGWLDIEVWRDVSTGAPGVSLTERGWAVARQRGVRHIHASLSHTHQYALAHAVVMGRRSADCATKRGDESCGS